MRHEDGMTEFEQSLTEAMRGVDAPAGFADRVMARVEAGERPKATVVAMPVRQRVWLGGALAACLAGGVVWGGVEMHARHERQAQVQREFAVGMRVTSDALRDTRETLRASGVMLGE